VQVAHLAWRTAWPWLEVAGPKETGDLRGEARLEKTSRNEQIWLNIKKTKQRKSGQTRKSLPNPNPVKPFVGEHQPPPDLSNPGGNKNSKTLMAWGHKNSANNSQGWEKTIPHHKKAREEAPLGEGGVTGKTNLSSVALSRAK
jgi:hypothetical protein